MITNRAVGAIEDASQGERPLFLQADYYEPHPDPSDDPRCGDAALPDPRDADLFVDPKAPRPPSFNEEDVSDKPPFMQRQPPRPRGHRAGSIAGSDATMASMRSLDRGIAAIVRALDEAGELDDTAIAYMSDNGVVRGHHRIGGGKHIAYQETLRVPIALRVPPELLDGERAPGVLKVPRPTSTSRRPSSTSPARSHASADGDCRVMDGRSLVPALSGSEPLDPGRVRLIEIDEQAKPEKLVGPCKYRGMIDGELFYLEYEIAQDVETGECVQVDDREMYDLAEDPYELENLLPPGGGDPAAETLASEQAEVLEELHDCQGIEGRDPEPPEGISYCE